MDVRLEGPFNTLHKGLTFFLFLCILDLIAMLARGLDLLLSLYA